MVHYEFICHWRQGKTDSQACIPGYFVQIEEVFFEFMPWSAVTCPRNMYHLLSWTCRTLVR